MNDWKGEMAKSAMPWVAGGLVVAFLWLKRDKIAETIRNALSGFQPASTVIQQKEAVEQALRDSMFFTDRYISSDTHVLDEIINQKTDESAWIPADNPYMPGYSLTIVPWVKK